MSPSTCSRRDGRDLRALPLVERRRRLQRLLPEGSEDVAESLAVIGRGRMFLEVVAENDLEGIVAKRLDGAYGRGACWWKIKNPRYTQADGRGELLNRRQAKVR